VGAVRFDVVFSVRPDGDACVLEARTEPKVSPYDLGGARDVLDRVCARFVERFASGALPRDTLPVTAIPKSALALLSSKGSSLGTLRDLQPDAPAALATLYAGNGETRRVLVVLLAFEAGSDLARRAAAKVRAGGAQHARGGPGFVLLPLEDREDARKLARRIARVLHESQPDRGTPAQQALTKNERLPRRDEAATRDERRKR
jgi:hypothetical protein